MSTLRLRYVLASRFQHASSHTKSMLAQIENEPRAALPTKQGASESQTSLIAESIYKISGQLSTITRNQKYFRTRENRNFSTVKSTENRIFRFSIIENLFMVAMAGLQVFIVRFFFTGARKGMSADVPRILASWILIFLQGMCECMYQSRMLQRANGIDETNTIVMPVLSRSARITSDVTASHALSFAFFINIMIRRI